MGVVSNMSPLAPTGPYPYTRDLCRLQSARPPSKQNPPDILQSICSPLLLRLSAWKAALAAHPDKEFRDYVLAGILFGFRIRYDRQSKLRPASRNMPSAEEYPEVVEHYLRDELAAGRILGPFSPGRSWASI